MIGTSLFYSYLYRYNRVSFTVNHDFLGYFFFSVIFRLLCQKNENMSQYIYVYFDGHTIWMMVNSLWYLMCAGLHHPALIPRPLGARGLTWQGDVLLFRCRPQKKKHLPDVGLLLAQRRRRWANIIPTSGKGLVFGVVLLSSTTWDGPPLLWDAPTLTWDAPSLSLLISTTSHALWPRYDRVIVEVTRAQWGAWGYAWGRVDYYTGEGAVSYCDFRHCGWTTPVRRELLSN